MEQMLVMPTRGSRKVQTRVSRSVFRLFGHQTGIMVEHLHYCKPGSGPGVDYNPTYKVFLLFSSF